MTSLNIQGTLFDLSTPVVMGIVNVTPDSFYDGGTLTSINTVISRVQQIVEEGGKIVDIGGYSSRPGANEVSLDEELNRVVPIITEIKAQFPSMVISIDTFRREVAEKSVLAGAAIVNDISGGELDPTMYNFVAESKTPYVMMHMRGNPATMQHHTTYDNLIAEIQDYFLHKIEVLHNKGLSDIIIDPGFGFAKTMDQNYELMKHLDLLQIFDKPLLVGVSRKSMIQKKLNVSVNDSLTGTIALNMFSLQKGANILRVHDVKEAQQCITLYNELN